MAPATSLPKDNSAFSLALFKQLSNNNKTGNIFFSPFSIFSALAMVMLGARGNTATQMSECLQTGDCWGDVDDGSFAKLLTELNRTDAPFTFSVANRLYREKSCSFTQEFLIQSKKHYSTELESVDFKTRSEEVRIDVNNWVQQQTPGGSHLHMYTQSLHLMSSSSSHVFHKQDSLLLLSPSKVRSVHL
ncbi:receptor-type tyrosine-protein phosphatase mu [Sarotherodon galilaeus]